MTTAVTAGSPPITRPAKAAVALAVIAFVGPLALIVLYLVTRNPGVLGVDTAVLAIVLGSIYEVAISLPAAIIALVLVLAGRRRSARSRRVGGMALTILGISVTLFVLQLLLYFPFR